MKKTHSKSEWINGLQDVFKISNMDQDRNFRNRVYQLYHDYKETKNIEIFRTSVVESIRADFDVIGVLVRHKNIDKKLFLLEYGPQVFRCWVCLKDSINDERERRKSEQFMENFEWLAIQARKFCARKGEDLSKIEIYDTRQR
jgi:hypothetical protein